MLRLRDPSRRWLRAVQRTALCSGLLLANDAWLLGGIHAQTEFHFASPLRWENLWDSEFDRLTVTGREVVGIVDAVTAGESGAILRVNGRNIQLDNVLRVDRATPTPSDDATAPAPATGADQ